MRTTLPLVLVGLVLFGCNFKDTKSVDQVSGTYMREYSFKVVHPETGAEIGTRTVRDTIFIRPFNNKFEVSNHKWSKNDYDLEGWQSLEHADDRPLHTFTGSFNAASNSIHPLTDGLAPVLSIDFNEGILFIDESKTKRYSKLKWLMRMAVEISLTLPHT